MTTMWFVVDTTPPLNIPPVDMVNPMVIVNQSIVLLPKQSLGPPLGKIACGLVELHPTQNLPFFKTDIDDIKIG